MSDKWMERQNTFDKLFDFTQENFTGIRVIKAFVKELQEFKAFEKVAKENADVNIDFAMMSVRFDVTTKATAMSTKLRKTVKRNLMQRK